MEDSIGEAKITPVKHRGGHTTKVYVVMAPVDAPPTAPNMRCVCVKLTLAAAHSVAARHTGAYIERMIADKVIDA